MTVNTLKRFRAYTKHISPPREPLDAKTELGEVSAANLADATQRAAEKAREVGACGTVHVERIAA